MLEWILYILYALLVFGLLVLFHELGHFAVAKLAGVQVYEFSIGFGPRVAGFRKGETAYNLRSVPLGGYVRMAGMDPEEDRREAAKGAGSGMEDDGSFDGNHDSPVVPPEKSFMHKSVPKRMAIIAAGPLMNFVLAVLLFAFSFWIFGKPTNLNVIGDVSAGRPAEAAGLKPGDQILSIDDKPVRDWNGITKIIHNSPGKKLRLEIKRDGAVRFVEVVPRLDRENNVGMIGIVPVTTRPGVIEALGNGVEKTHAVLKLTFGFIGKMIARQMPVQLSGPVRITYELGKAAEMGFTNLLFLAGFLSLQIGLFNLLPIPALDGSRIMFLGLEGIRGTPIDPSKENVIHLVGLALLLLLMVVITYQDVVQMIG